MRVHDGMYHVFKTPVNGRAVQLDGLRAIAMLAICWDHWCPSTWPRLFPFEICLFLFLVLTGYLITGSLLRERDRSEARGGAWKYEAMKSYQIRRGLRILAPYYTALALAWLVWAPDMHSSPLWYVFHVSNIHMASLADWPSGTNHFWSLSMQQQFYLVWPFVIWFSPRKLLIPTILLFAAIGPAARMYHDFLTQWFLRPEILTWASFDYFGTGALLALGVHRGMRLESPLLRYFAWVAFAGYLTIFISHKMGAPTFGTRPFQQTLIAIALCGLIATCSAGVGGFLGRLLENRLLQRVGQVSYGIYLFHNLAPLVAGKLFWFLWYQPFDNLAGHLLKMVIYALVTWVLAQASWKWIEQPLQEVRSKLKPDKNP